MVEVELVPEADSSVRTAVDRAMAVSVTAHAGAPAPWWQAGLGEAHDHAALAPPRPSDYEAVRSPRRTLGATRA